MPRNSISGFSAFADDLREFASETAEARERTRRVPDQAVDYIAHEVFDATQRDVPVKSGQLKNSGKVYRREDGVWVIRYTADHALAIEGGADPHIIEPRDADALRFETESGEVVYTMRVRHPGNDAQPFLGPNIDAHREQLPDEMGARLVATLRRAYR